jgi:hypothetical protein
MKYPSTKTPQVNADDVLPATESEKQDGATNGLMATDRLPSEDASEKDAPTAEPVMEKDSPDPEVGGRRMAAQNTGSDGSLALDTGRNIQWLGELNLRLARLLVHDYMAYSERRRGVTKKSLCRRWGATLGVAQSDPTGVCVERAAGRLVQAFDKAHELALSANFLNETEDGSIIAKTQQLQAICPEYVILRPVLADGFISRNRNNAASSSDVQPPAFTAQRKRKRQTSVPRSVEPASAKRNDHGNLMNLGGDISSITASVPHGPSRTADRIGPTGTVRSSPQWRRTTTIQSGPVRGCQGLGKTVVDCSRLDY